MIQTRYKSRLAQTSLKLLDVGVAVSLLISLRERHIFGRTVDLETFQRISFTSWHLGAVLMLMMLWYACLSASGLYNFRTTMGWGGRLARIFTAGAIGAGVTGLGAQLVGLTGVSGSVPFLYWGTITGYLIVSRAIIFGALNLIRRQGRNIRFILVIGWRDRLRPIIERLNRAELGYHFLGYLNDETHGSIKMDGWELARLGDLDDLAGYISRNPVDELLLALPVSTHYSDILRTINIGATQGVTIRMMTDLFDIPANMTYAVERFDSQAFITYTTDPRSELQYDVKRAVDCAAALGALILLSPVLLVISAAVFFSDGWPIFFVQERIGLNKRRFKMFKFRTMVKDAEALQAKLEAKNEANGAVFKISHDPRVTALGRFLRKTSLDELPQFINVLLGQMSLVGPRPLPLRDFERFYNDAHRRRFSVKPGLTGLWQVSGRSDVDFEEWMKLDLYYVDNWSYLIDLRILIQTVRVVLLGRGAY